MSMINGIGGVVIAAANTLVLRNGSGGSSLSTLWGSEASSGTLTLASTAHATKGKILFGTSEYDEVNNRLGIGITSPTVSLHVAGQGKIYDKLTVVKSTSTSDTGGLLVDTDPVNGAVRALFLVPPANTTNVFVGSSVNSAYTLDFTYCSNGISNLGKLYLLGSGEVFRATSTSASGTIAGFGSNSTVDLITFTWTGAITQMIGSPYGDMSIETQSNYDITLLPNGSGKVGVGNASPTVMCDVTGDVLSSAYIKSTSSSAGVGYGTGAGGTVTQLTDKSTSVTLNKICGQITTHNANLNDATTVSFTVDNTTVAATDVINLTMMSGGTTGAYLIWADTITASTSFKLNIRNVSGGTLGEALVVNFAIMKAVSA
jgi:hypothetical protein